MSSDKMCRQNGCRVYEIIVITTNKEGSDLKATILYEGDHCRYNFNWTDRSAVWGMSSRITYTTLINEVLTTVAVNVIWKHSFQLPTMVWYYVYDVISSQPPIATTCSNLQNFSKYLAYYIRIL